MRYSFVNPLSLGRIVFWGMALFGGVFSIAFGLVSQEPSLRGVVMLHLSAERTAYAFGEDIDLEVEMSNLTTHEIVVPKPTQKAALRVKVVNMKGEELRRMIPFRIGAYDSVTLAPNSTFYETISLAPFVNDTSAGGRPGGGLIVGKYRVRVGLLDIESNEVVITVFEPTVEDRAVGRLIVEKLISARSREEAIEDARALIRQYPRTVYLSNIYLWLMIHLRSSRDQDARSVQLMAVALEYIRRFPRSIGAESAIGFYVDGARNQLGLGPRGKASRAHWQEIESKLAWIKEQYPSERIQRYINRALMYSRQAESSDP